MRPNLKKRNLYLESEFRGHRFKSISKDVHVSAIEHNAQRGRPWSKA
jgi:hypothetical protein